MQTIKTVTEVEMPVEEPQTGSSCVTIMQHVRKTSIVSVTLETHSLDGDIYYTVKLDNLTLFGLPTSVVSAIAEAYNVEIRDNR